MFKTNLKQNKFNAYAAKWYPCMSENIFENNPIRVPWFSLLHAHVYYVEFNVDAAKLISFSYSWSLALYNTNIPFICYYNHFVKVALKDRPKRILSNFWLGNCFEPKHKDHCFLMNWFLIIFSFHEPKKSVNNPMYPDLVYCTLMLACRSISADEVCRRDLLHRVSQAKWNKEGVFSHLFTLFVLPFARKV